MGKAFKKGLLLCYRKYSLFNSLLNILRELSVEANGFDIREELSSFYLNIHSQIFRFPNKIRNQWESFFLRKANYILKRKIIEGSYDIIFVYNSEFLLPETCEEIKKNAKLVFFMGDSPFFTPVNPYYLRCLTYADLILSPDSFWINQLNTIGIKNIKYFIPGIDTSSYYLIDESNHSKKNENLDIIYTGASYVTSWGYKKALLMNQFAGLNFRIYGNKAWEKWFKFFPELKNHYTRSNYISTEKLNLLYNMSRLIPVDGNPGIINGFHLRMLEALGSGVLPLVEYRKDMEELIPESVGVKIPVIKDYSQARNIAVYYLKNETERRELVYALRNFILSNYSAQNNAERIKENLGKK